MLSNLLYLSTQIHFRPEENVSPAVGQNSLIAQSEQNPLTQLNNSLNFRIARYPVVLLEPRQIFCGSRQANEFYAVFFFSIFEVGVITKLMTDCVGNSEFCFPLTSTHCFPWGQSLSAYKQLLPLVYITFSMIDES